MDGDPGGSLVHLVVVAGNLVGRRFPVEKSVLVGRSGSADIVLDEQDISREHARITRLGVNEFVLEDLKSCNGTYIHDVEVHGSTPVAIGDRITMGSHTVMQLLRIMPQDHQLRQRQRLEALGRLTLGVAHDLNNLHGAILATLDYLEMIPPGDEQELRQCLADLRVASGRAAELPPRLLSLARADSTGHRKVSLSSICEEVIQLVQHTFDRRIDVQSSLAGGLSVLGDAGELHQVLMNLCLNARDAMPDGGVLMITAAPVDAAEAGRLGLDLSETWVKASVQDSGVGMDAHTQKFMFEEFFTTKGAHGVGLGLATVREIVTLHGGLVLGSSEEGKGTRFDLYFPRFASSSGGHFRAMRAEEVETPKIQPSEHTILLVDDEPTLRRTYGRVLRRAGYRVSDAPDGFAALGLYSALEPRPSVVVLDLNMPKLGGVATFDRLRRLDPKVRVLFLSGEARLPPELARIPGVTFLKKPCDMHDLFDAVEQSIVVEHGVDVPFDYADDDPTLRVSPVPDAPRTRRKREP